MVDISAAIEEQRTTFGLTLSALVAFFVEQSNYDLTTDLLDIDYAEKGDGQSDDGVLQIFVPVDCFHRISESSLTIDAVERKGSAGSLIRVRLKARDGEA